METRLFLPCMVFLQRPPFSAWGSTQAGGHRQGGREDGGRMQGAFRHATVGAPRNGEGGREGGIPGKERRKASLDPWLFPSHLGTPHSAVRSTYTRKVLYSITICKVLISRNARTV